ncbi:mechanosensitive ion channel family protein [Chondromyces apiculatus]|uniref:Potassium efflux system KefA protein / Small-conductance mechanosensitive channel n=1 Tax=Chondromyces apiculatus DSM 436 TaxID=1192034 RepID=A0A017T217_9BACT|nr:mechanosensitive ion channel domain-containing protein [Chondromyces apiculatus]EYF03017.1 Potassium efflux system KefA protein / Small-conductance mechanosensitive channel [Chondromyces apiculatus DSM 436]
MEPDQDDIEGGAKLIETIQAGGVVTGLVILAVTWFLVRIITAALERSGNRFVHRRLMLSQLATLTRFGMYIGGIAAAIGFSLNLSKEVVLALTGTVAVTIGFALKDLASSILAGLTLIVDRPFQVGDRVHFEDYEGEITAIGLRSVRLRTEDNLLVTIPNNKFLTESVASANQGRLDMMVKREFFVSADQDLDLAKRIVEECITSNRYVFLGQPWAVSMEQVVLQFGTAVRLEAEAHVLDMKYKQDYQGTLTERVLAAFREKNVILAGGAPPKGAKAAEAPDAPGAHRALS